MQHSNTPNPVPPEPSLPEDEAFPDEEAFEPTPPPGGLTRAVRALARFLQETFYTLFLTALLYLVLNAITARIRVEGYSMVPTLQGGEFVLVYRLAYRFGRLPQRGDIIVFRPNDNGLGDYIKRVIALPGEEVLIQNGTVYINNHPLYEPYLQDKPRYNGYWRVPEDSIFVLGDNRNHSTDSHILGPVPLDRVIGQAILVYWPPDRIRWLEHADTPVLDMARTPPTGP